MIVGLLTFGLCKIGSLTYLNLALNVQVRFAVCFDGAGKKSGWTK
jgi:hypothetical protein